MITFYNPGLFDLEAALTFGVSSKDSDSAIGEFGTGLKYAIAVCLREGQTISATIGSDHYKFHTEQQAFRNDTFDFIFMTRNDESPLRLGFTTHLGKNWELWQAYRELYCNALDEGGGSRAGASEADTVITVEGLAIHEVHAARSTFLLEGEPDHRLPGLDIHLTPSNKVFHQGILVLETQAPNHATYNITQKLPLTEDRTASEFDVMQRIQGAVLLCEDSLLLTSLIATRNEDDRGLETRFDPRWERVSSVFERTMKNLYRTDPRQVGPYIRNWVQTRRKELGEYDAAEPTNLQLKMLERAKAFLAAHNHDPDRWPIEVVQTLGSRVHGKADPRKGKIYLSIAAFNQGTRYVASTLLEEIIHLETGYLDLTRELQTYLFDKLIGLYEEQSGDPL